MKVFLNFLVICGDVYKSIANYWEYYTTLCDPSEIVVITIFIHAIYESVS